MDEGYSIEMKGDVCFVTFKAGTVVTPEMVKEAVVQELIVDTRDRRIDLWDFRGCAPAEDFDFEAMRRIVGFIVSANKNNWNTKAALLVDEQFAYGLLRMFLSLSGRNTSEVCVFYDEAEAFEFLGLNPA